MKLAQQRALFRKHRQLLAQKEAVAARLQGGAKDQVSLRDTEKQRELDKKREELVPPSPTTTTSTTITTTPCTDCGHHHSPIYLPLPTCAPGAS